MKDIIITDSSNLIIVVSQTVPSLDDQLDALEHASQLYGDDMDLDLSDFSLSYLGMKSPDDLYEYDDLSGWLELDYDPDTDLEEGGDLEYYRGEEWAEMARGWLDMDEIPPIVVVELPDGHTTIGDGRGRINLANLLGMELSTYLLSPRENRSRASKTFQGIEFVSGV